MSEYIKFETKRFLKNRRNQFLFLGMICFWIGLFIFLPYQNVNDIEEKVAVEAENVRNAIAYVPVHEVEKGDETGEYPYYEHILQESRAVAAQEVALTMHNDIDQYVTNGINVTNVRIEAHQAGYGSLPEEFIIPLSQSLREKELYHYLQNHSIPIERNAQNGANALFLAISWFSAVSFFFLLFLSSDVLTEDEEHKTIISAYPLDANRKVLSKILIHTFSTFVLLLGIFLAGYVLSLFIFRPGTLNYPIALYWRDSYTAVPTYLFVLLFFCLFLIFTAHIVLFSCVLNIIFKNKYLNIFVGGSFYVISFLFSESFSFFRFTPMNYLDPAAILNGRLVEQFNQPSNDVLMAVAILILWSVIYSCFLSVYFSKKNRIVTEIEQKGARAS